MKIGVIRFPGTNNEFETIRALDSFYVDTTLIESSEIEKIDDLDGIWLPGGFSYGDVLRAGAIAAKSEIMDRVSASGVPIFGPCNGFQILTEANLLPGALLPNKSTRFICKWVFIQTPELIDHDKPVLKLPIAHFEGNLYHESPEIIKKNIYTRYVTSDGVTNSQANPNGSLLNIAGLISDNGRIIGLMPHPERASFKHQGSTDGRVIIDHFIEEVKR